MLQAASLERLGSTDDAVAALRAARQRRLQFTLGEVAQPHGHRVRARLALLWERAG